LILSGARFSFGVFFNPIAEEFDLTRTTTSSIQSVYTGLCIFITFVGGWALDKYGPKVVFFLMGLFTGLSFVLTSFAGSLLHIYFSYSLLFAMGTASYFPVINATISKWFDKKRGIALGIAASGSRSGQAAFAPLSAFLISAFNWRYAYLITGLLTWIIVLPLSRFMKKDPRDIGALPDGAEQHSGTLKSTDKIFTPESKDLTLSQALRKRNYWYMMPMWLFSGVAAMMLLTHIVPHAIDMNISPMKASTIITIIGIVALPSGIFIGRLVDIVGAKIPMIVFSLFWAVAIVNFIWAKELWHFYLIAGIIGFCTSGIAITITTLTVNAFGKGNIGKIMASLDAIHSIGATIGPLVGGLVYDTFGNYNLAFLLAAIGLVISGLAIISFRTKPILTASEQLS
jgi:MFS family permease